MYSNKSKLINTVELRYPDRSRYITCRFCKAAEDRMKGLKLYY